MPLACFLPKDLDLISKCRESLTPSSGSAAVAAMGSHGRKVAGIQFREKRLAMEIWKCNGIHQKGSHFPICVFTNNVGRRSPEKLEQRRKTSAETAVGARMQKPQFAIGGASAGTASTRGPTRRSQLVRTSTRRVPTRTLHQWIPNIQPGQQ